MFELKGRHAAGIVAVVAIVAYGGVTGHEWASDDVLIIQNNPAAHAPRAALAAWFEPYWPSELTTSGQYRPLTVLMFAGDWAIAGDRPAWFHVENVLWHAAASAALVAVLLAWLPPVGALGAGVVFAVHPVHVEAVANVVGRGELVVALGFFALVLLARRYRAAPPGRKRSWLIACLVVLAASLFVKEHAVVAIAVLALDEWLTHKRGERIAVPLYVAVAVVTLSWAFLFRGIAGQYVELAVAATIRDLSFLQRLATMLPVQLDVVRLLVWPLHLAADYNPLVILRRESWSLVASIGLATAVAIILLALRLRRWAPAVSFGVLLGVISYAPTSNLVFPSGIILSERNLYLAVAAPAAVVGWLVSRCGVPRRARLALLATVAVAFGLRTVSRVPIWRDGETVLIEDFAEHQENYRARMRVGRMRRDLGDLAGALADGLSAGAIFPQDPWVVQSTLVRAIDLGNHTIALREALRAYASDSTHPSFARFVVRAHLAFGEAPLAVPIARQSLLDAPESLLAAESYAQVLDSVWAPAWRRALARAEVHWVRRELLAATDSLSRGITEFEPGTLGDGCWDLEHAERLLEVLRPDLLSATRAARRACGEGHV